MCACVVASANSFDFSFHSLLALLLKMERIADLFTVKYESI
jgi:hypothetical protein